MKCECFNMKCEWGIRYGTLTKIGYSTAWMQLYDPIPDLQTKYEVDVLRNTLLEALKCLTISPYSFH